MLKYLWKNIFDMPPSWLVFFLFLTWFSTEAAPSFVVDLVVLRWLGWLLTLAGVALMFWAFLQFQKRKTSVIPRRSPKAFIAEGPYRFSRNPIYLADALILAGVACILGAGFGPVLVALFVFIINTRFIRGEEEGLAALFPEAFDEFCRKTRRWI